MAKDKDTDVERAKGAAPDETIVAGVSAPHVRDASKPGASQPLVPASGAPSAHMVKVKDTQTGRVFAAWPVDAREMVTHPEQRYKYATGEDELTPQRLAGGFKNPEPVAPQGHMESPTAVDPQPPAPNPPFTGPSSITVTVPASAIAAAQASQPGQPTDPLTATDQLSDKSKSELQDLAKRAGIDPNQNKADLVDALAPHVVAGTVTLQQPEPLARTPQPGGRAGG